MSAQEAPGMDGETAERIVGFVGHQDGVLSTTVATLDGSLLASLGARDASAESALAAFVCERAEALGAEGDLRGMGKLVSEGAFEQLEASGPRGDRLFLRLAGGCMVATTAPGALSAATQAAAPVINRFGRKAGGR